jgi:hypothetical protein
MALKVIVSVHFTLFATSRRVEKSVFSALGRTWFHGSNGVEKRARCSTIFWAFEARFAQDDGRPWLTLVDLC